MRNDILFGILITLLQKGKCTYNQLAEKFEVSKRTIQRYCLTLEMSGIPTFCTYGRNGGIQIMGSFNLQNMFFTKPELQRLLTHLHASPLAKLDNIDKFVEEKLIMQTSESKPAPTSNVIIDYTAWSEDFKPSPIIKLLNEKLGLSHCYDMTYLDSAGAKSTRTISPYKFIFKESKWYLYAYCHTKKSPRVFKINRIQELVKNETTEYIPSNLTDDEIKSTLASFFDQIEIKIKVKPCAIPDTLEWLDDHSITYTTNGDAIITGTATNNNELISRIISNPTKLELLAPESLLEKLRESAKSIKNLYL